MFALVQLMCRCEYRLGFLDALNILGPGPLIASATAILRTTPVVESDGRAGGSILSKADGGSRSRPL